MIHLSGSRASWGVTSGKVCFEVKLIEITGAAHAQSAGRHSEVNLNDLRVGFSAASANNQLGEDKHSYGITMAGKKCTQKYFEVSRFPLVIAYCTKVGVRPVVLVHPFLGSDP